MNYIEVIEGPSISTLQLKSCDLNDLAVMNWPVGKVNHIIASRIKQCSDSTASKLLF